MFVDDFIWILDILDRLAFKHQVTPEEAEEVFFNEPHFRLVERGYRAGEDVYSAWGQTDAGRYMIVFSILKSSQTALILSARDMDKNERRYYDRSR